MQLQEVIEFGVKVQCHNKNNVTYFQCSKYVADHIKLLVMSDNSNVESTLRILWCTNCNSYNLECKKLYIIITHILYVACNQLARVRFLTESEILINFLGLGVCVLCVLSCVVSGSDPDVLITHSGRPALLYLSSVLVHSPLLHLQTSGPWAFGLYVRGVSPTLEEGK